MADDPNKRGPADRTRVNIHEPYEVEYWSKHFGVTPDRLRQAVQQVGPMVENVRKQLGE